MNVTVTLEQRYDRTPDGAIWSPGQFAYPFWQRYLEVFDEVRVVARVQDVAKADPDWQRADGEAVRVAALPHYIGPQQYARSFLAVQRAAREAVRAADAVILRVSSQIAACVEPELRRSRRPYGVEVVVDPYYAFASGAVNHPLRRAFRWKFQRDLRRQCYGACAASYVTEYTLQRAYPPGEHAFTTHYSSVDLPPEAFAAAPRSYETNGSAGRGRRFTLVTLSTMAQTYKGVDVLIDAVAAAVREGADLELVLAGEGKYRPEFERRAATLGLGARARFLGQVPYGAGVREVLDRADLFVLPSRSEGLPRAIIEAMARGLPCIGSTVSGIPELLPAEDLVPPDDVPALTAKIREVLGDRARMQRMSVRNLAKAEDYREELLRARRRAFYRSLRETTERWLHEHGQAVASEGRQKAA